MGVKSKITCKTGSYKDKDGNTKGRYKDVGVVMENDNGEYIIMDATFSLAGGCLAQNIENGRDSSRVLLSIWPIDNDKPAPKPAPKAGPADYEEEVPFR